MTLSMGSQSSPTVPTPDLEDDLTARTTALPTYTGGYGYDQATATMTDHNGFEYSYLPDGIIKLVLPWGYTTYFSFGLTASYLGVAQKVTALSYTWTWTATATAQYNATGVFEGYDYTFRAVNSATLAWTIQLDFYGDGANMKITHTLKNGYANALMGAEFWFIFDLTHTPTPSVTTKTGTYYPPLYLSLPASITWARLSNQFQFDWRDAGWPNGHAYLGSGSIIGLSIDILGIGVLLGDIPAGATRTVDPYFSGVTRTWAATGNSYSGIAASWSPAGVPATGDNITFDATSVYNCNWNTTVTVGTFSMNTGYTGVMTQAATFSVIDFSRVSGTSTFSTAYTFTVMRNLNVTGGTTGGFYTGNLIFGGTASTVRNSLTEMLWSTITVNPGCTVNATLGTMQTNIGLISIQGTLSISGTNFWKTHQKLEVGATGSIILGTNSYFTVDSSAGSYITNLGSISGTGSLNTILRSGNTILRLGAISCLVRVFTMSYTGGNYIATFGGNYSLTNTLSVFSYHPTYTATLDLSASNYALSCAGLTVGARGILLGRGSQITDSGAWDSSAGTFTAGTSSVHLTGATKTVKTANTNGAFYDLSVEGTYTTASSVNVTHALDVHAAASLTVGAGKTVTTTVNNGLTNLGTVIGTGAFVMTYTLPTTISPGAITTAPTTLQQLGTAVSPYTVTLGGDWSVGALLTIDSLHTSYPATLDTGAYDLTVTTASDLVLTNDAYLMSGAGVITVADDMTLGAPWGAVGTTVSVGDILSLTTASLTGTDITTGDLITSGALYTTNGSIATTDDLTVAGVLAASGTDFAVDDDCTLSGASVVDGGDFTVDGDLNVTATTALTPDTLGLWALRVLGSGSMSVTSLSLETTEDLYVGPAASLTTAYDLTVGGNWTVLGTWTHGDQVVYLTGTGGLEMSTANSFWNITVSLTATIGMDNDTYVELRATILGSMTGAGTFIEPAPVFTSSPTLDAVPLEVYNYTISQGYWDTLALVDGPAWLSLYGTELKGVPTETDAGPVDVSLSLTWNGVVTYQNYTLWVSVPSVSVSTTLILEVVLAMIMGIAFMVIGFWQKESPWTFFAGLIWIFTALAVFAQLGAGWTILSLGLGLVLLIDGGTKIAEQR